MDIQAARKWYRWLWLSPLVTIPTLLVLFFTVEPLISTYLCPGGYYSCRSGFQEPYFVSAFVAVLGSSLWHLLLLIPALNQKDDFVRWHGIQGLILAGLRTAVPLATILLFVAYENLISLLLLVPLWFFGTLWGQQQASRGDCSLMRWTGREDLLPGPQEDFMSDDFDEISIEGLEATFLVSEDPRERQAALEELEKRGLVENL